MFKKKIFGGKLAAGALALAMVLSVGVSSVAAQNNSRQLGLVNVSAGDVELLNNVNIAVAANVIATVCGLDIAVALLAAQGLADGGTYTCPASADEITIEQSQAGGGAPNLGGNSSRQAGLVNVSLGDVAVLNDVNLGVVANVLITVCGLTVSAAVLAAQGLADGGTYTCPASADEIIITQA